MSLRYIPYDTTGGREGMACFGPSTGPQVVIVPPLLEEASFTRAVLAEMARRLAERGIGAWLIDLPGTGESVRRLEEVSLGDWREAVAAAARTIAAETGTVPHLASVRGGALIDDLADTPSHWRFAAADGSALIRQMERAQAIGDRESGRPAPPADAAVIDLIGYRIGQPLLEAIRAAKPVAVGGPSRDVPFAGPGAAPWRLAEPAADPALSGWLADDLADWIATCAA